MNGKKDGEAEELQGKSSQTITGETIQEWIQGKEEDNEFSFFLLSTDTECTMMRGR